MYLSSGKVKSVDLVSGEVTVLTEGLGDCRLVATGQTEARHATDSAMFECFQEAFLITNLDSPDERIVLPNKVF